MMILKNNSINNININLNDNFDPLWFDSIENYPTGSTFNSFLNSANTYLLTYENLTYSGTSILTDTSTNNNYFSKFDIVLTSSTWLSVSGTSILTGYTYITDIENSDDYMFTIYNDSIEIIKGKLMVKGDIPNILSEKVYTQPDKKIYKYKR
jgi:hypothetical protein